MQTDKARNQARHLFEVEGMCPAAIGRKLKIPRSTVYWWSNKLGWTRQEEIPETIVLRELKRLIGKPSYSETDLRKLKNLQNILDEYEYRRSILAREIEQVINRHRGSSSDKSTVLNELINLLNKHTGSTIRSMKDLSGKQPANDFRRLSHAE